MADKSFEGPVSSDVVQPVADSEAQQHVRQAELFVGESSPWARVSTDDTQPGWVRYAAEAAGRRAPDEVPGGGWVRRFGYEAVRQLVADDGCLPRPADNTVKPVSFLKAGGALAAKRRFWGGQNRR